MKKKIVSHRFHLFSNIIFHSLCLSGLIWQITQISVNYFEFDVVSDISLTLPEDVVDEKILNFCYDPEDLKDKSKFLEILEGKNINITEELVNDFVETYSEILTLKDRFDLIPDAREAFYINSSKRFQVFLMDVYSCYQIKSSDPDVNAVAKKIFLDQANSIFLGMSEKFFRVDIRRLSVHNTEVNMRNDFYVEPHFYLIRRLKKPYKEECIDYFSDSAFEKHSARADCTARLMLENNTIFDEKIYFLSDQIFMNATGMSEGIILL